MDTEDKIAQSKKISKAIIEVITLKEGVDREPLDSWRRDNKFSQEVIDNLTNEMWLEDSVQHFDRAEREEGAKRLVKSIKRRNTRGVAIRVTSITASVAAAILFISFLINNNAPKESMISANRIVSYDYTVPTLILQSGESIGIAKTDRIAEIDKNIQGLISNEKLSYNIKEKIDTTIYNKLVVPAQCTYTVILADSTEVTLNANTILEYPIEFNGDIRDVKLTGEAYFKVTKSDKPFIVTINDEKVQVYGTQFNIKSYDDKKTEVILVEGSIGYSSNSTDEIMMKPNQMLTRDNSTSTINIEEVESSNFLTWRENRFKHINKDIYTILSDIALWYGIDFKVNNKLIDTDNKTASVYTFIVSRNATLEHVIRQLSAISNLTFINEGRGVYTVE